MSNDDDDGAVIGHAAHRLHDGRLAARVETGGRLVKEEHPRPAQQCPGQCDSLQLAGGEACATRLNHRSQARGSRSDLFGDTRRPQGRPHVFVAGIGLPEADGVLDGRTTRRGRVDET